MRETQEGRAQILKKREKAKKTDQSVRIAASLPRDGEEDDVESSPCGDEGVFSSNHTWRGDCDRIDRDWFETREGPAGQSNVHPLRIDPCLGCKQPSSPRERCGGYPAEDLVGLDSKCVVDKTGPNASGPVVEATGGMSSLDPNALKEEAGEEAEKLLLEDSHGEVQKWSKLPDAVLYQFFEQMDGRTLINTMDLHPRLARLGGDELLWRKICMASWSALRTDPFLAHMLNATASRQGKEGFWKALFPAMESMERHTCRMMKSGRVMCKVAIRQIGGEALDEDIAEDLTVERRCDVSILASFHHLVRAC